MYQKILQQQHTSISLLRPVILASPFNFKVSTLKKFHSKKVYLSRIYAGKKNQNKNDGSESKNVYKYTGSFLDLFGVTESDELPSTSETEIENVKPVANTIEEISNDSSNDLHDVTSTIPQESLPEELEEEWENFPPKEWTADVPLNPNSKTWEEEDMNKRFKLRNGREVSTFLTPFEKPSSQVTISYFP